MSYQWTICLTLASHLLIVGPAEAKKKQLFLCHPLPQSLMPEVIHIGARAKGTNAFSAISNGRAGTTGFNTDAFTPFMKIVRSSSWEKKAFKKMIPEQPTEKMTESVLRVYDDPDLLTRVTPDGRTESSGVDHGIIRNTKIRSLQALQMLETRQDVEHAQNDFGAEAACSPMFGDFEPDDVIPISKIEEKYELFIVVIGTTGEEKKFKVKTKHFERLP